MDHVIMSREASTMETTLCATVLQVNSQNILVCDRRTNQEVLVHTENTCRFSVGDRVRIQFNGIMTMSIPPQISASCIRILGCH